MLGIVIGTVCLIGLVRTLRWGRGYHGYGHGGGCGGGGYGRRRWGGGGWGGPGGSGGWGDEDRGGWGGGGWDGPSVFLRGLFQRLDTTPGQEKVIRQAIDEVRDAARTARGELRTSRADLAKAVRGPAFDEVLFGDMFARHDTTLETLRKAGMGALAKVHDALDERQRAQLADLIESGPGIFRRGPFAHQASL